MRPEGVRKALYEAEGRPSVMLLSSGKRIPIRSREHWMIGDEYLYVLTGSDLNTVDFRNIAAIEVRNRVKRVTQKSVQAILCRRPFRPLEVRMVDGQRFRLTRLGRFIVSRDDIATLTKSGTITYFSIGLIAAIRPITPRRRRA